MSSRAAGLSLLMSISIYLVKISNGRISFLFFRSFAEYQSIGLGLSASQLLDHCRESEREAI